VVYLGCIAYFGTRGYLYETSTSREVIPSLFPPFPYFRMRKRGGNNKETGCLATRVTILQLVCFYSEVFRVLANWTSGKYQVHLCELTNLHACTGVQCQALVIIG